MAGLGFKDFAVGEVLTAADVDGYLMQQSVMRFADAGARGSALGTAVGTGVPLAEGMVSYLDDLNQVQVFDGTSWAATGKVLQVVSSTMTNTFSTTATTFQDVTNLSTTITPSSSTSKVLVIAAVMGARTDTSAVGQLDLRRDGTSIIVPDSPGSRTPVLAEFNLTGSNNGFYLFNWGTTLLDAPATTSAVTYKVMARVTSGPHGAIVVNRSTDNTDSAVAPRGVSAITLLEIAA